MQTEMIYRGELHCRMLSAISQGGSGDMYLFNSYLGAFQRLYELQVRREVQMQTDTRRENKHMHGDFPVKHIANCRFQKNFTWLQAAAFNLVSGVSPLRQNPTESDALIASKYIFSRLGDSWLNHKISRTFRAFLAQLQRTCHPL